MEHHPAVDETLREFRSDLCAELRDETDVLTNAGLRAAIRAIDDITTNDEPSAAELYVQLMEIRHASAADEDEDEDEDEISIAEYDPDVPFIVGPPIRMVIPEGDTKRYSPDQPRRPNGEFGTGDGDTSKLPSFLQDLLKDAHFQKLEPTIAATGNKKEDAKGMSKLVEDWLAGGPYLGSVLDGTAKMIQDGDADKSLLVQAIRNETVNQPIYRGLHNVPDDELAALKVGADLQLSPQSFSADKSIATSYANGDVKSAGAAGHGTAGGSSVVYTVQGGLRGFKLNNYMSAQDKKDLGFQKEVVTAGHFQVISRKESGGTVYVSLRQTQVF